MTSARRLARGRARARVSELYILYTVSRARAIARRMQADSRPRAREAVNDANRCARGFRQVISERAIGRSCAQYLQRKRRNSQRHTSQGIPARAGSANRSAGRAREKVARQRAERCARNARIRSSRPACARHPRARAAVRIIYQSQSSRAVARDASCNIDNARERLPRAAALH